MIVPMIPKKKWFIKIGNKVEGPFSKRELRERTDLTPDTLAKREGWTEWKRLGDIRELADLFQDAEEAPKYGGKTLKVTPLGEVVLDIRQDPPQYTWWLVILLLIVIYLWLRLQGLL